MVAPGRNIRLRVPMSPITNKPRTAATVLAKVAASPTRPASTAPFDVVCEVHTDSAVGPIVYRVSVRQRLSGASWTLRKRYSQFHALHTKLVEESYFFLPIFPPKDAVGLRREPAALAQRAHDLARYSRALLARSDMITAPQVAEFFQMDRGGAPRSSNMRDVEHTRTSTPDARRCCSSDAVLQTPCGPHPSQCGAQSATRAPSPATMLHDGCKKRSACSGHAAQRLRSLALSGLLRRCVARQKHSIAQRACSSARCDAGLPSSAQSTGFSQSTRCRRRCATR